MLSKLPSASTSVTKHSNASSHSLSKHAPSYARPAASRPERSVRLMHVSSGGTNTSAISNRWGRTIDAPSHRTKIDCNPTTKQTSEIQRHTGNLSERDLTRKHANNVRARASKHKAKYTFKRVPIGKDVMHAARQSDTRGICGQCHAQMPITYSFCTKCGSALS